MTHGTIISDHCEDTAVEQTASRSIHPTRFTYPRLYCTPDGTSHFEEVTVDLCETNFAPPAAPVYIGGNVPASSGSFGGFDAGWGALILFIHEPPRRNGIATLSAHVAAVVRNCFKLNSTLLTSTLTRRHTLPVFPIGCTRLRLSL